jgi:uncharacterized membrane protein
MSAFANYGKDWQFKTISDSPSVDEVEKLIESIIPDESAGKASSASAAKSPSGGGGGGGGGRGRGGGGGCALL